MITMRRISIFLALLIFITLLLAATGELAFAQTEPPASTEEATPIPPTDQQEPQKTRSPARKPTSSPEFELTPTPTVAAPLLSQVEIPPSSRQLSTIEGPLTRWVADFTARNGWNQIYFLGLSVDNWINLGLSILIFILIYILGKWVVYRGLRALLKRTAIKADEEFLEQLKPQINWLVLTVALQLSLARLDFLSPGLRVLLNQVFFVAYLTIITVFLWKVIVFTAEVLLQRRRKIEDIQRLRPIYMMVERISQALLIVGYFSILLTYFGIDVTAFAAALGIGGLAISLAAQDTLADAIAGFLILWDQPFRVGDRIEISGLGTWGDVVEIGTRSTRIRTLDNRLVVVPNSAIAKDQVVNYTYPDPQYRVQIEVGLDYSSDLKLARETAIEAVRHVEGVLSDKPVDALFVDFGDSSITFRIRWWIHSYADTRRMFDKVNEALLNSFNQVGIKLPNMTYDLNLKVDQENLKQFTEGVRKDHPKRTGDPPEQD
jgi:MscS family membrane protein